MDTGTIQPGTSSEKLLPSAPAHNAAASSPYPPDIDLDKPSIAEVRKARQIKAQQASALALGQTGVPPGGLPGDGGGGPPGGPPGGGMGPGMPGNMGDVDGVQQSYEIQVKQMHLFSHSHTRSERK